MSRRGGNLEMGVTLQKLQASKTENLVKEDLKKGAGLKLEEDFTVQDWF